MHTRPTADATRRQVLAQLVERAEARPVKIHLDTADHILERLSREVEGRHVRCEREPLRRARRPAFVARRQFVAPARKRRGRRAPRILGRQLSRPLVHIVVNRPAEVPDGDDGAALWIREHNERVIEIGVAAGHGGAQAACGRLQEIAFHRRAGTSDLPRVGLAVKTSNPACSRRSRMRIPPSQVSLSS